MNTARHRIGVIARREYRTTVRRREFLLVTFGLPLLYVVFFAVIAAATVATAGSVEATRGERAVGFFDASGQMSRSTLSQTRDGVAGRLFESVAAGQTALRAKQVRAFVVIPKDFAANGSAVTVYQNKDSLFSGEGDDLYTDALRAALLEGRVDPAIAKRVVEPIRSKTLRWDEKKSRFVRPDPLAFIGRFAIPYAFSLLLSVAILTASSYLLHGVVEEKENRVIEVLLSAATHEELLWGKLIGLGGAGLTQLGLWVASSGALVLVTGRLANLPPSVSITPGTVATALLFFVLGFALYAAAMAGIGSMGTSWRESQQMASIAVLFSVVPLMLITVILELPDAPLARALSLFPPTAPVGMMLRVAAGGSSLAEVALSALLLALSTWATVRLSARIFRLSLLMYGQRPTPKQVWRWLRTPS